MTSFTRLQRDRTSHEVYQQLRARILDGSYLPQDRLPTERELMETFGVSRTTVREGMRRLEQAGLIVVRRGPKGGAFIRQPDHADASDALSLVLRFDRPAAAEMLEARVALEADTARLAASRASEEELARMQAAIDAVAAAPADPDAYIDQNWVFHMAIAEAAHNRVLRIMMNSIQDLMRQALNPSPPTPPMIASWLAAHRAIHSAIAARRPAEAERLMISHLRDIEPRIVHSGVASATEKL